MTHAALQDQTPAEVVLLPCPFCGSAAVTLWPPTCEKDSEYNPADRAFPIVRCGCGVEAPGENWDHKGSSAVAAWNRRAALSAMEGEAVAWLLDDARQPPSLLMGPEKPALWQSKGWGMRPLIYADTAPPPQQAVGEAVAWQVRVMYGPHGPDAGKWSKWQDTDKKYYDAVMRGEGYFEYKTAEGRALIVATHPTPSPQQVDDQDPYRFLNKPLPGPQGGGEGKVLRLTARQVKVAEFALRRFANDARLGADYAAQKSGADKYPEGASARFLRDANDIEAILAALDTPPQPEAQVSDEVVRTIACELARIDGFDPEDERGGLYDLRWSGGPTPEPLGDSWNIDYLPKAERIARAALTAALTTSGRDGDDRL